MTGMLKHSTSSERSTVKIFLFNSIWNTFLIGLTCRVYACTGSGEIDWKQLSMVVGSEMLKFETEQAAASEAGQPGADDASLYASPRGPTPSQTSSYTAVPHVPQLSHLKIQHCI